MGMTLWIQTLEDRDYAQDSDDYSLLYRYTEPLDALCATLGMMPLSSFFDDSDLLFNFTEPDDEEDASELDPETGLGYGIDDMAWFDAAAGLATLSELKKADYDGLAERTKALAEELAAILRAKGAPVYLSRVASLFTLFFCEGPVTNFEQAKTGDTARYAAFYNQMREAGVLLAPSAYECAFTSFAHSDDDFARTIEAAKRVTL